MDSNDDKRRDLIGRAMSASDAARRGDANDYRIQLWKQLVAHLGPLIGESGFSALYRRTVRLVSNRYEWLNVPLATCNADELLVALRYQLAAEEAGHASEANVELLTTFTKLLSGLIGEALTIRLLDSAWNGAGGKPDARDQT